MLQNPNTAVWLYFMLVIVGFMFGKRWQGVRDAIVSAGTAGQTKATDAAAG